MSKLTIGLCKGRHSIDFLGDKDYIFDVIPNPSDIPAIESRAEEWVKSLPEEAEVDLVITGLTQASIAVLKAVQANRTKFASFKCWHFNQARSLGPDGKPVDSGELVTLEGSYVPQVII